MSNESRTVVIALAFILFIATITNIRQERKIELLDQRIITTEETK